MRPLSLPAMLTFLALGPSWSAAQSSALIGQWEQAQTVGPGAGTGAFHLKLEFREDGFYRWTDDYTGNLNDYLALFVPADQIGVDLGEGSYHAVFEGKWAVQGNPFLLNNGATADTLLLSGTITEHQVNGLEMGAFVTQTAEAVVAQMAQQGSLSAAETEALKTQITTQFRMLAGGVALTVLSQNRSAPYFIAYERLYIGAGQPDLFFIYDRSSPGSAVSPTSWAQVKSGLVGGR